MSLIVSTRKLPVLTDQPQKAPATIQQEEKTIHLMKWEKHRRSSILPKNEIWISSRNVLTMCFLYIHFSIVTFLHMPTGRNSCQLSYNPCIWRYGTSCNSYNANFSVPLESMTAPMHCFTRTTQLSSEAGR